MIWWRKEQHKPPDLHIYVLLQSIRAQSVTLQGKQDRSNCIIEWQVRDDI